MLFGTKKTLVVAVMVVMVNPANSKEASIRGTHRQLPSLLSGISSLDVDQNLVAEAGLGDTDTLQKLDVAVDQALDVDATVAGIDVDADLRICIRLESGNYELKVISHTDVQGMANAETLLKDGSAELAGTSLLGINCQAHPTSSGTSEEGDPVWVCVKSSDSDPSHELLEIATLNEAQSMVDRKEAVLALTNDVGGFYCTPRTIVEDPLDFRFEGFGFADRGNEGVMVCMQVLGREEYETLHAFSPTEAQAMIDRSEAVAAQTKDFGSRGHFCIPQTIVNDPIDLHWEAFGEATREPSLEDDPNRGVELNLDPTADASDFGNNGEADRESLVNPDLTADVTDFGNNGEADRESLTEAAPSGGSEPSLEDDPNRGVELNLDPALDASDFGNNGEADRESLVDASPSGGTGFAGVRGDPHFAQWDGTKFDFHGQCDLVLIDNSDYDGGLGLKVHLRTKLEGWYSFVSSVAVKIGEDVLEIDAGYKDLKYWRNGQEGSTKGKLGGDMPFSIGGNEVRYHLMKNYQSFQYKIVLSTNDQNVKSHIVIRSVKGNLRVSVDHPAEHFTSARGLMGSYGIPGGTPSLKLARDGATVLEDANEFGREWQVHPSKAEDSMLFHVAEGAQYPEQCTMPSAATARRRLLGDGSITFEEAARACAHLSTQDDRSDCATDVIALGDLNMAGAY